MRQILGWREFVRGVYWLNMPAYAERNFFQFTGETPAFFWDGETDLNCVKHSLQHVLDYGYSHHIHRLMVLGNLSLLLGVHPHKFHEWHMAMYVDAIDWVSLPNTLGMSQFGDGGLVGTKPYTSTGSYIDRMSNYCSGCRFDPSQRSGDSACPFTVLYWDFLDRHEQALRNNHRMGYQFQHLKKLRNSPELLAEIRRRAEAWREAWTGSANSKADS